MGKEKDLPAGRQGLKFDSGYSEKALDLAVDKGLPSDQTKAGNIFVNPKKTKKISNTK